MMIQPYLEFFLRDLNKLKEEIQLYKNENDLWKVESEIQNSAGTLTLHLIGNLKHFIGAQIGFTGYVRNRDREFSDRNISREKLILEIEEAISIVKTVLPTVKDEDFSKEFPVEMYGAKRNTGYILLSLSTHFCYHLGQINYHRRLLA
ncbi:MAG: DUF1572 family protein [Bacteroidota bacterium]|jgi:hypothetical protein